MVSYRLHLLRCGGGGTVASESKRLFVVGSRSGNTASRACGARKAGWQVYWSVPFWSEGLPFWWRVPQYRLRDGPSVWQYNHRILQGIVAVKPDIVWVESPMFLYPNTLRRAKMETGCTLVCAYSDDPRDPAKRDRHFDTSVNLYDVLFFTKDELMQSYLSAGCRCVAKFWKGYDPSRIKPVQLSDEDRRAYRSNIAFIGHADFVRGRSMRLPLLSALAAQVPGIRIWGRSWSKANWPSDLKGVITASQMDGDLYTKAVCAARIALQIPSRLARDTHSSRSVEIPACGTMLLAERTTDHLMLFDEDREAVYFGCVEELVDKARYYLNNDGARQRIAEAGRKKCEVAGYSNENRMVGMLDVVQRVRHRNWIPAQ